MITVRFSGGFSVQYNSANYVIWGDDGVRLFDSKDSYEAKKCPIARVPNDCIIEFIAPCRTCDATKRTDDDALAREVRTLQRQIRNIAKKVKP